MSRYILVLLAFFIADPAFAQDHIGKWTLTRHFGYAGYSECQLTAVVVQGKGSATIRCVWNGKSIRNDLYLHHDLTSAETATLLKLAQASDLYAGGHAGRGSGDIGSDGPFDTLTVFCCGESQFVILVTQGNLSFKKGPRRELLALLHKWRQELTATAERDLQNKRRK